MIEHCSRWFITLDPYDLINHIISESFHQVVCEGSFSFFDPNENKTFDHKVWNWRQLPKHWYGKTAMNYIKSAKFFFESIQIKFVKFNLNIDGDKVKFWLLSEDSIDWVLLSFINFLNSFSFSWELSLEL